MQTNSATNAAMPFDHTQPQSRVGVLLLNVGSPDEPTPAALRRYLAQFLSDPRVIEPPPARWLWLLILHGIILRVRPKKSAQLYANIWTPEGSPLIAISRRQREGLQALLSAKWGDGVHVAVGMGYGSPSLASAMEELTAAGCRRVLVVPMFPQYSAATTGSAFDGVAKHLMQTRWVPELRFIHGWHDEPDYIDALAATVRETWATGGEPDRLMVSFHGLPRRYLLNGDPYFCLCHKTGRLLLEKLAPPPGLAHICFQSRFGREPWLQPYTDKTLQQWAREGVKRVDIMSPGFSADCLETLEELGITNRELFEHAAPDHHGLRYRFIPCLNDRADHLQMLAGLIERHLAGWPLAPVDPAAGLQTAERAQSVAAACPWLREV